MRDHSIGSHLVMVAWEAILLGALGCSGGSEAPVGLGRADGSVGHLGADARGAEPTKDADSATDGKSDFSSQDAADGGDLSATSTNGSCTANELPCGDDGGTACCFGTCTNGMCGVCLAEGTRCHQAQICCDGLECNDGYCGTNLCVPDTTPCNDPAVVCCNDDCNNGKCGG